MSDTPIDRMLNHASERLDEKDLATAMNYMIAALMLMKQELDKK